MHMVYQVHSKLFAEDLIATTKKSKSSKMNHPYPSPKASPELYNFTAKNNCTVSTNSSIRGSTVPKRHGTNGKEAQTRKPKYSMREK